MFEFEAIKHYSEQVEILKQENERLREALDHIGTITFKGSKDFDEFIKAWPNSISIAKDSDALSSLIYGFVKKALEETK